MKAFTIKQTAKVYAYSEPVSMAFGFPRLAELAKKKLSDTPTDGDLFLFINKKATYVKVLFWSKDGWCIFAKKLPNGKFDFEPGEGKEFSVAQLTQVVDHVVVHGSKKQRRLRKAA